MTPFHEYLIEEILPEEKKKARVIRRKARRYAVTNGVLYKKFFLEPWLRCVGPLQANYVLKEIHEGSCSMHVGPRSVVAKALRSGYHRPTIHADARKLIKECNDCQDNIVCIFGLPGEIIFDNRKQFTDNPFKDWCENLCIRQCFASVKHPQANGLVERANRSLGEGIKESLDERSKNWLEKISLVLWAHRTMIKSRNGETPFSLTYGTEAVILIEIGMPTLRTAKVDIIKNDEALGINLDLLEEKREQAAIQEAKSKAKMEKYYNAKVHNTSFSPGDFVYQNNKASHAEEGGKLGPKWEGPYEVTKSLGK
ncbi:reverse transcriptase domain-containing protein [Tanacetum coccineum]|uniref:Reverse transcriptase domain-containing protein n=1 Tax=Tanacetum coccineum TaxID=301880 RepID=A0ABQ5AWR6_9ASTR